MLHEPAPQFDRNPSPELDAEGHPILDASAYIDAMRAVGAKLIPIRGRTGEVDCTFDVLPSTGKAARLRVAVIEAQFASRRAADPHANARIGQALFDEAARQRFASLVGDDFSTVLLEFARLDDATAAAYELELRSDSLASDDPARIEALRAADIASEQHQQALDYVMAMPIKTVADVGLKAQFAVRFGETEEEWLQVLQDIAGFFEAKTNPSDPSMTDSELFAQATKARELRDVANTALADYMRSERLAAANPALRRDGKQRGVAAAEKRWHKADRLAIEAISDLAEIEAHSMPGILAKAAVFDPEEEAEHHDLASSIIKDLRDLAAKTPTASPPIAQSRNDGGTDPIISIRNRAQALRADAASRALDDPEADDIVGRYLEIEREALAARPTSFAGAIAALEWAGDELRTDEPDDELVQALVAGAAQHFRGDASRTALSSASYSGVDPVVAMRARFDTLKAAATGSDNEAIEARNDQLNLIEDEALKIRPMSSAGVIAALEWAAEEVSDMFALGRTREDFLALALIFGAVDHLKACTGPSPLDASPDVLAVAA